MRNAIRFSTADGKRIVESGNHFCSKCGVRKFVDPIEQPNVRCGQRWDGKLCSGFFIPI